MERSVFSSREYSRNAGSALIRCAGMGEFGHDSIARMATLARALRDCEGIGVGFAVNGGDDALTAVRRAGFEARKTATADDFSALVRAERPDIVILDGSEGLGRDTAQALRGNVTLMAAIGDDSDLRLACDFAYYPPVPQAKALGWAGARTVPRIGWEYSLLGLDPHPVAARAARPALLVAMGASDPLRLTTRAARLLAPLDSTFRIRFVIGRFVQDAGTEAAGIVAVKNNYETVEGADDLSTEYASAELALCAFGVTAYELAAFGVPAVYLGLNDDHACSAAAFVAAGMGVSLGVADRVTDAEIFVAVKALMESPARRRDMRIAGLATMDGGGAVRIAADLAKALREERVPLKAAR
jgi:spore coat polysaccharide biosynthesis protein SpsF